LFGHMRDAPHVNLGNFHAGQGYLGNFFRYFGYLAVIAAVLAGPWQAAQWAILAVCLLVYLIAWKLTVGALWRIALVAAGLVSLTNLAREWWQGVTL
jgi:hypothetical protein